ncbi:MAG: DUF1573 domain-containing protein [Planctomycetota bacterium]
MNELQKKLLLGFAVMTSGLVLVGLFSQLVEYHPHGLDPLAREMYAEKLNEIRLREELAKTLDHGAVAYTPELVHDFGFIDPQTTQTHGFVVENRGTKPLSLTVASTSCKCTIGKIGKSVLHAGESTRVEMEWNTGLVSDDYEQVAAVTTNDASRPIISFTVKGTVRIPIGVEPPLPSLGKMDVGQEQERVFSIYSQSWDNFTLEELVFDDPKVQWSVEPHVVTSEDTSQTLQDAKAVMDVRVTYTPDRKGSSQIGCTARLLDPEGNAHEFPFQLRAYVRSPISFYSPDIRADEGLDFGTVTQGQTAKFSVVVRNRSGVDKPLKVLEVVPSCLDAEIEVLSGNASRLVIAIPEDCPEIVFNRETSRGYVSVGIPGDDSLSNWFPLWGAVAANDTN